MEVEVRDKKLKSELEDDALCLRRRGKVMAKFIRLRMDALCSAESLHDFWPPKSKPERVHKLIGDLAGLYSIDLMQPFRLLFKPVDEPVTKDTDEQAHWRSIKKIEVVKIEDTHG